jgi:hypothetical protein
MALRLVAVPPRQGLLWVRRALGLFLRKPLPFASLFMAFMLLSMLLGVLPFVGGPLLLAAMPLLSLGYIAATRQALQGGAVHPGLLAEPVVRAAPPVRKRLLLLCALHGALAMALVLLWVQGFGEPFRQLWSLLGSGQASEQEVAAAYLDPRLQTGLFVLSGLWALLQVPFWHAPALVLWGGQGVRQAMFSSTVALWRTKGALAVALLAWVGLSLGYAFVSGIVFALLGVAALAALGAFIGMIVFTSAFYVSLFFIFADSFTEA